MVRKRLPRTYTIPVIDSKSLYTWRRDREEGFSEVQFVYDKDGNLLAVDYKLPAQTSASVRETR